MTLNNKTKDNIIKSTVQLIQKKGYFETSIQEIVKQSKAPQGSIYYYFPKGKDEIICTALDKISDEFNKTFTQKSKDCKEPEEVLRLLIDLFVNKEEEYDSPSFRITLLALETVGQSKTVADKASEMLRSWKISLTEELEKVGVNPAYSLNIARWFCTTLQGAICSAAIKENTTFKDTMENSIQLLSLANHEQLEKIFKKSDLE